jgi:hypothetical protein
MAAAVTAGAYVMLQVVAAGVALNLLLASTDTC